LVDSCFKEFAERVFPGAPPQQVAALRTAFFAGAAELNAMLMYAADTSTDDATDEDVTLLNNVTEEIELFHSRTIATSKAPEGKPQ
jgi:hypothetical protein